MTQGTSIVVKHGNHAGFIGTISEVYTNLVDLDDQPIPGTAYVVTLMDGIGTEILMDADDIAPYQPSGSTEYRKCKSDC